MIHFNLTPSVFPLVFFLLTLNEIKLSCAEPIINADPGDPGNAPEKGFFSDYPFMVSIGYYYHPDTKVGLSYKGGHFCGGALVSKLHVVTAAHCFDKAEKKANVRVLVGISNFEQQPEVINVEGWTKYKDWPLRKLEIRDAHDIAVLKLKKEVNTSNAVPIPLYDKYYDKPDIDLETLGWGATEEVKESPDLLKMPLKIVPRQRCEREFQNLVGEEHYIHMWKVCTRSPKRMYLGEGDSGGPVIYKDNGVMKLFAVNEAQCQETCLMINVQARVYNYIDFIEAMIKS